ncbi:MAG: RNase adapter RapZ [Rhodospirillales bacterium]|nr:RNase adapter RapZ [Rhodospirillales bacterium]
MTAQPEHRNPLIITGLSGAGLSSVLKNLEDLGYEVFDNFPLSLVPALIKDTQAPARLAIGIDTRTRGFSPDKVLETVKDIEALLVYITCDNAVLQTRFTETRRRHPLADGAPVTIGIARERDLLHTLEAAADLTIDSSDLSIHDLRHILEGHFGAHHDQSLSISLISFGYRHGLPREADIVMDVRFLKNPHWNANLRPQTGRDKDVGIYIESDLEFAGFLRHFQDLIEPLIPRYKAEGKHYLTIAIGCTGGRHRSVFITEKLGKWLASIGHSAHITHRDLPG